MTCRYGLGLTKARSRKGVNMGSLGVHNLTLRPGFNKSKKPKGCEYGIPGCVQSNSETESKTYSLWACWYQECCVKTPRLCNLAATQCECLDSGAVTMPTWETDLTCPGHPCGLRKGCLVPKAFFLKTTGNEAGCGGTLL